MTQLQFKVAELLAWERRKRRERVLATILFYALAAALLTLPLYPFVPEGISRWAIPILFLVILAPPLYLRQRWRPADNTRALVRVDKALSCDERAVTAWEILAREHKSAAELLVLKEAEARLKTLNPRALFHRQVSWHDYLIVPLFALWFAFSWFDVWLPSPGGIRLWAPVAQAQKLREFSREMQQKAERERLRDSMTIGRELEKLAQKQLAEKASAEPFQRELSAMAKKIEAMGKASAAESEFSGAAASQQNLNDLKAELEAARDSLNFPSGAQGAGQEQPRVLERLAALPQLKRHFDSAGTRSQGLSQSEVKSFLDKLDRQVTGELDRRTLLDAQQFLEQLLKEGQGEKGQRNVQVAGQADPDALADAQEGDAESNQVGTEPGKRESAFRHLPEFQGGTATQLKGRLGEGESSSLMFKGKAAAGKSALAQDEVIASYRRQAEAELNTERVPERLKETIKRYFLSLGRESDRK